MKNIYFILILCVFASCSDSNRTIYGCLDPLATNYSPSTDIDDGSCTYEADIVFYLDANAAVYLGSQTNQINFFIDESFVGYDSYPFTFSLNAPTWTLNFTNFGSTAFTEGVELNEISSIKPGLTSNPASLSVTRLPSLNATIKASL